MRSLIIHSITFFECKDNSLLSVFLNEFIKCKTSYPSCRLNLVASSLVFEGASPETAFQEYL